MVLYRLHIPYPVHTLSICTLRHWLRRLRHWWLNPPRTLFSGLSIQDFPPLEYHHCPNMLLDLGSNNRLQPEHSTVFFLCLGMFYHHNTPHHRLQQPPVDSCLDTQTRRSNQMAHLICVYIWHAYNHEQFFLRCCHVYIT